MNIADQRAIKITELTEQLNEAKSIIARFVWPQDDTTEGQQCFEQKAARFAGVLVPQGTATNAEENPNTPAQEQLQPAQEQLQPSPEASRSAPVYFQCSCGNILSVERKPSECGSRHVNCECGQSIQVSILVDEWY